MMGQAPGHLVPNAKIVVPEKMEAFFRQHRSRGGESVMLWLDDGKDRSIAVSFPRHQIESARRKWSEIQNHPQVMTAAATEGMTALGAAQDFRLRALWSVLCDLPEDDAPGGVKAPDQAIAEMVFGAADDALQVKRQGEPVTGWPMFQAVRVTIENETDSERTTLLGYQVCFVTLEIIEGQHRFVIKDPVVTVTRKDGDPDVQSR